jgi:hypothetical protein
MGAGMAFSFQFAANEIGESSLAMDPGSAGLLPRGPAGARLIYSMAGSLTYVFPLLVGAMSITQEYRHKTITPTFLAEPRRYVVLAAKMVAALPMGLAYGLACLAATVGPAAIVLAVMGGNTGFGAAATWTFLGRALIDFTIWAAVGVGLGALIPNQVALIVVALAVTQFVEPTLRMVPAMTDWNWPWIQYLPGAAGDSIQGTSFFNLMGRTELLPWGWGVVVLAAWAALAAVVGYVVKFRRDVS